MKKFLVVCTALLLLCLTGTAQEFYRAAEADNAGRGVGLSVIPRLDLNFDGDFTFGDSSLYSLFEGNISDNLSFSICNHWASFGLADGKFDTDGIASLYKNTFRSDDVNWMDWGYATLSFGNFGLSLGKQSMTFGGFEFDAYDVESYSFLNSSLWNNLQVYQWGAKLDWTNESENTTLSLQMTTSPFGERPFSSKLYNYSFEWRGDYDGYQSIFSAVALQTAPGEYYPLISLGQKQTLSDSFTVALDVYDAVGDETDMFAKGVTFIPSVIYAPGEKFSLTGRLGAEYNAVSKNKDFVLGMNAEWLPLDDGSLRLHLASGYWNDESIFSVTFGLIYYLNFSL